MFHRYISTGHTRRREALSNDAARSQKRDFYQQRTRVFFLDPEGPVCNTMQCALVKDHRMLENIHTHASSNFLIETLRVSPALALYARLVGKYFEQSWGELFS